MPIHIRMLDFLRTGDFGGVKLGMTRHQLMELLGEPPDWSVTQRKKQVQVAAIWKYGSIEFHFSTSNDVLHMIYSDDFPLEGSETLLLDPGILAESLLLEDAIKWVDEANLRHRITIDNDLNSTYIKLASGVDLIFCTSDDPVFQDDLLRRLTAFVLKD